MTRGHLLRYTAMMALVCGLSYLLGVLAGGTGFHPLSFVLLGVCYVLNVAGTEIYARRTGRRV